MVELQEYEKLLAKYEAALRDIAERRYDLAPSMPLCLEDAAAMQMIAKRALQGSNI